MGVSLRFVEGASLRLFKTSVLAWMSTGNYESVTIQITDGNIEDLLAASDYLGVASLKNDCCEVSCYALWPLFCGLS